MQLSLVTTVPQVLHSDLVYITSLPRFHFSVKYVIKLCKSHGRNLQGLLTEKVKDVDIFQFTQFIKALVKRFTVLICFAKELSICSKPLKNILVAVCANWSMKYGGHGIVVMTMPFLHIFEDFTPIILMKMHQVVVFFYLCKIFCIPPEVLQIRPCHTLCRSGWMICTAWLPSFLPSFKSLLQKVLSLSNL